jgi:membrane protein DedA with SNARE-associated domain
MAGYRVLAFILGLIFLALAVGLFFHDDPRLISARSVVLEPDNLKSALQAADPLVKKYVKFALSGGAFVSLGLSLLFFVSVFSPLRMIPFITVLIICSILWIPGAIWAGYSAGISWYFWGGEAIACTILAILLVAFFPRPLRKEVMAEEAVKQ